MWYGESDKVSVVKKEKKNDTWTTWFETSTAIVSPATAPDSLLGILNANRKIRKRTDTDVAFTREYSRVSIFHRERECTN